MHIFNKNTTPLLKYRLNSYFKNCLKEINGKVDVLKLLLNKKTINLAQVVYNFALSVMEYVIEALIVNCVTNISTFSKSTLYKFSNKKFYDCCSICGYICSCFFCNLYRQVQGHFLQTILSLKSLCACISFQ